MTYTQKSFTIKILFKASWRPKQYMCMEKHFDRMKNIEFKA